MLTQRNQHVIMILSGIIKRAKFSSHLGMENGPFECPGEYGQDESFPKEKAMHNMRSQCPCD
jgi:hypothetical protein